MKKFYLLLFVFFLICSNVSAQNLLFANAISGANSSVTLGTTSDNWGNTYATGWYNGTVDFDPSAATYNLTTIGSRDIFVVKYDSQGAFKWAKSYGSNCTTCSDEGVGVAVSATGKVYVTGLFLTTCDFDLSSSAGTLVSSGDFDIFILQLDTAGAFGWVGQLGGSSNDVPMDITLDAQDNIYLAGQLSYVVDIDPSPTVQTVTANTFDGFVAKITPSGQLAWGHLIGAAGLEQARGIAIFNDNVYVCGSYKLTVDFDPGTAVQNRTASGTQLDFYVLCLDKNGIYKWVYTAGSPSLDLIEDITTDINGNIVATGYFQTTVDFDGSTAIQNKIATGVTDAFILNLDSNSNLNWVKTLGVANFTSSGFRIASDPSGNIYTCGSFETTMDFDPGAAIANASTNGLSDIYILKLSNAGNYISNTTYGGTGDEKIESLKITNNNMIIGGEYEATCDFDASAAITNLISAGGKDAFICKYSSNCVVDTFPTNVSACDFVTINNITYSQSGTFYIPYIGSDGCDSIVKMNLQINTLTAGMSAANNVLTASPAGAQYQWINCATNTIISGATNQVFTPSSSGSYAVIVTQGACKDTSICMDSAPNALSNNVNTTAISIHIHGGNIVINNLLEVTLDFDIYDITGSRVAKGVAKPNETITIDVEQYPKGVYFVRTPYGTQKLLWIQ
jgi:hypothetical protein